MLKPSLSRIGLALLVGFCLILLAAWFSGSTQEICKEAKSGQEQCPVYNLAPAIILIIGKFLDDSAVVVTALATLAIAGFTWTLWQSSEKMWKAANKTASLMREDMTNTHRPRLRIRNVVVQQPQDALGKKWPRFHRGHVIRGQFYIVNVGAGRADILDGHCTVLWTQDGLPMARPYEGAGDNLSAASRTLLSGESTLVIFQNEKMVGEEGSSFGMRTILGHNFYVMGWVTYADRNNNVRRTAFCREYFKNKGPNDEFVGGDGRFFPVNNPDYEHEE